jgi:hypothetical protein
VKEQSSYLKHSNQIHLSLHSGSRVIHLVLHLFSHNTDNNIGTAGVIKLSEALKSNSTLTELHLGCTTLVASFILNHVGNDVGKEGAVNLSEALKSNSSLATLSLHCNRLYSFISFSLNTVSGIGTEGAIKLSEALKLNSTLTDLDLNSNRLLFHFILTQCS